MELGCYCCINIKYNVKLSKSRKNPKTHTVPCAHPDKQASKPAYNSSSGSFEMALKAKETAQEMNRINKY